MFVSIKRGHIFRVAELMRIKKQDLNGNLRELSCSVLDNFTRDRNDISIFTSAEILATTRYEINNMRAGMQQFRPVSKVRLFEGQSVGEFPRQIHPPNTASLRRLNVTVEKLLHKRLITDLYPLHQPEDVKRLAKDWYGGVQNFLSFHQQPLG